MKSLAKSLKKSYIGSSDSCSLCYKIYCYSHGNLGLESFWEEEEIENGTSFQSPVGGKFGLKRTERWCMQIALV